MTTPALEILLEGRIVCGHPMSRRAVKKKQNGSNIETPVIGADNQPVTDVYVGLAIPKGGETDWKQTAWGQQIYNRAVQDWPNGEHGAPTFSWKVADGDSAVPNTKNKKPCDREGWPGHWVVHASTQLNVRCFHVGKYDPMEQIQVENEIKTGDYGRLLVDVKGNGPVCQSPGVYINPVLFELSRAGAQIISDDGPDAASVFGGGQPAATQAAPAQAAPAQAAPAQAAPAQAAPSTVQPAPDFLQGGQPAPAPAVPAQAPVEVKYLDANGNAFTEAQLLAANFTAAQIAAMPRA